MKKVFLPILFIMLVSVLLTLTACGGGEVPENPVDGSNDGKIFYEIRVVDPFGTPVPDMLVNIFLGEESIAVKMTDSDGVVKCQEDGALDAAEYTFKLVDPRNNPFYYDEAECVLSGENEKVTVTVYSTLDGAHIETLYLSNGISDEPVSAPALGDGGYRISLKAGKNYFVFAPTMRGRYCIDVTSCDDLVFGYYGSPHFVQDNDLAGTEDESAVFHKDGKLYFDIRSYNIGENYAATSRYVIMIECEQEREINVTVECDENLSVSVEELPWDEYTLATAPTEYTPEFDTGSNYILADVDITLENLTIIYNSEDGFYHLDSADGPVILVKMTVSSDYIDAFSKITETTSFSGYVYDADGNLVAKRDYHSMMLAYIEAANDEIGVYPLTEGLKCALIDIGGAWGWYKEGGLNNLFSNLDGKLNPEIAYLFACCYFDGYAE